MAWYADVLVESGGAIPTLALFESTYQGADLSGTDGVRARIKGTTDDNAIVYFTGWYAGQSASCKIVITAESGYGISDRTSWTGADGSGNDAIFPETLDISEPSNALYMDITNIEFNGAATTGANCLYIEPDVSGSVFQVCGCLFRDAPAGGSCIAIASCGTTTTYVANCLFRDWSSDNYRYAVQNNDDDSTVHVWNCTMDGGGGYAGVYGRAAATTNIYNCTIFNVGFKSVYDNNPVDDYSAADDNNLDGANSIDSITVADNFTNAASEDYTVKSTDASCEIYHAGTDQPAWFDTLSGGLDIVGNPWHATTPSMGCFEYAAAAPGGYPFHKRGALLGHGLGMNRGMMTGY